MSWDGAQGRDRGVQTFPHVVAVVVSGLAEFSLVPVFDPIFIYKRDDHDLHVLPEPFAVLGISQEAFHQALYHVTRRTFTSMMATSDEHPVFWLTFQLTDMNPLHRAILARFAKLMDDEVPAPFVPRQEAL